LTSNCSPPPGERERYASFAQWCHSLPASKVPAGAQDLASDFTRSDQGNEVFGRKIVMFMLVASVQSVPSGIRGSRSQANAILDSVNGNESGNPQFSDCRATSQA